MKLGRRQANVRGGSNRKPDEDAMTGRFRKVRFNAILALLTCVAAVSACGGGSSNGNTEALQFIFVANSGDDDISAFVIDASSGSLARIDCGGGPECNGADFVAGTTPVSVQGTPSGKFLYVANLVSRDISAYAVAPTGALKPINCGGGAGCNGSNFTVGVALSLAVHPSGQYLYVANSAAIAAFAINASSGALSRIDCGGGAGCSGVDFAPGLSDTSTPLATLALSADPLGRYVYVVNDDGGGIHTKGYLSVFGVDVASGALAKIDCASGPDVQCTPYSTEFNPGGIPLVVATGPAGDFVYVGDTTKVVGYSVEPAPDILVRVGCTSGPAPPFPLDCTNPGANFGLSAAPSAAAVAPTGKFVHVTSGNGVAVFAVQPDGTLARIGCVGVDCAGADFSAGTSPAAVAFDRAGAYAYVTDSGSGDVSAFHIEMDGTLTRIDCGAGPDCSGTSFAAGAGAGAVATVGG